MSGTAITQERPLTTQRMLVSTLFTPHRRVVVRLDLDTADAVDTEPSASPSGPEFCTCGDVWPCRSEDEAARILFWA